MISVDPVPRLSLSVDNIEALQHGSASAHVFDANGGTIGAPGSTWVLFDPRSQVQLLHCEVLHEDGGFLIVDHSGQTIINDQTRPLGRGVRVRLSDGDRLHIGRYRISARLEDGLASSLDSDHDHLPADAFDALPEAATQDAGFGDGPPPGLAEFQSLAAPPPPQGLLDPLLALDAFPDGSTLTSVAPGDHGQTSLAAQADVAATQFEAVYGAPMHAPGDPLMLEQDTQPAASREWLQRQLSSQADPASLAEPLVEGIGAAIGAIDAQDTYVLLNEAGRTLGALVRGLSALNAPQNGEQQRISLAGRTLQPIEDNPLRLGLDYPDTVRALFSAERSVVHLSPSAAVEESLEQIRRQQMAVHKAVNAGLAALLQAFSPEQLEHRFQRYRHTRNEHSQSSEWAWTMYGHYYEELTSGRQQGFDKLFWEVFDQAFDQAVRAES